MCLTRKIKREKKRKYRNKIVPINDNLSLNNLKPPSPVFTTDELILCNGCNQKFSLESNEIQIHCAGCHKFYHCKIAGTCYGPNCYENIRGNIHRLSWCINCVPGIPENKINKLRTDKCICHQCSN